MKYDVLIIGAGYYGTALGVALLTFGKRVGMLSAGLSKYPTSKDECRRLGGDIWDNCKAVQVEWNDGMVAQVKSDNDIWFQANDYVLATGKYFSGGLISTQDSIFEPLFSSDVYCLRDRQLWCNDDFFSPQPFESFGVCHHDGRVLKQGQIVPHLYAIGSVLQGDEHQYPSIETICQYLH